MTFFSSFCIFRKSFCRYDEFFAHYHENSPAVGVHLDASNVVGDPTVNGIPLVAGLPSAVMSVMFFHTAKKIPFMYSFSVNSVASVPISTFVCL